MSEDQGAGAGELLFAGTGAWGLVGRGSKTKNWDGREDVQYPTFSRLAPLKGVPIALVVSGATACHTVAISRAGAAYVWGRNEEGQLGLGDRRNRYNPTPLTVGGGSGGALVKGAACGAAHTLIWTVTPEGGGGGASLFGCGRDECGQLGLGRAQEAVLKPSPCTSLAGTAIVAAGAGRDFSCVVDADGGVYTMGRPEYGQLGNGTEGKSLERAGKITFSDVHRPWRVEFPAGSSVKARHVACGQNHTAMVDGDGYLWTWGFGGYGRCGHKDAKDVMRPRSVEMFQAAPTPYQEMCGVQPNRAQGVMCGAACTYAVSNVRALYFFGITKRSGEATMYPKLVDDVSGWSVRAVSSGFSSTLVASETSLISFGPSPTWGELGYGPDGPKSSTRAQKVDSLEGSAILQVASGYGHSLAILDTESGAGKALIEEDKIPTLDLDEVEDHVTESSGSAGGAKRKAGGGRGKGKAKRGRK